MSFFSGNGYGIFHGKYHPNLRDSDHKAKANWAAVILRVVPLVEKKVGGGEAKGDKFGNFLRGELSARG